MGGGVKLKEMQGDGIWTSCLATAVCFPGVWADWGTLAHLQTASLKLKLLASEDGSVGTTSPSQPPLDSYCQPLSTAQSNNSDNSIYLRQMSCFWGFIIISKRTCSSVFNHPYQHIPCSPRCKNRGILIGRIVIFIPYCTCSTCALPSSTWNNVCSLKKTVLKWQIKKILFVLDITLTCSRNL